MREWGWGWGWALRGLILHGESAVMPRYNFVEACLEICRSISHLKMYCSAAQLTKKKKKKSPSYLKQLSLVLKELWLEN